MSEPRVAEGLSGMVRWDQQEAKIKFSEVVRRARAEGPQLVTTRGSKPVVVISGEDYLALTANRPASFLDLLVPGDDFEPIRGTDPAEHRQLPPL